MNTRQYPASTGKTILVTGASGGIGKQTALALAEQGNTVIMHGRNPEKTRQARDWVVGQTGNPHVSAYVADLSLMAEVARFAADVTRDHDRLDVLVNNAGGQFGDTRETIAEGHEKTFAINTLAPFLRTVPARLGRCPWAGARRAVASALSINAHTVLAYVHFRNRCGGRPSPRRWPERELGVA